MPDDLLPSPNPSVTQGDNAIIKSQWIQIYCSVLQCKTAKEIFCHSSVINTLCN